MLRLLLWRWNKADIQRFSKLLLGGREVVDQMSRQPAWRCAGPSHGGSPSQAQLNWKKKNRNHCAVSWLTEAKSVSGRAPVHAHVQTRSRTPAADTDTRIGLENNSSASVFVTPILQWNHSEGIVYRSIELASAHPEPPPPFFFFFYCNSPFKFSLHIKAV